MTMLEERPVLIDPRIRQRRIDVARETGRRRLRRLMVLGCVVVIILIAISASMSPLLDVDRIDVTGTTATPADSVVGASGIGKGDAMVRLDLGAAAAAIEQLPWVADAEIRRHFPGAVEIVVAEREPVGIIRVGDEERLFDATGRILGPVELGHGALPRVEVTTDIPPAGQTLGDEDLVLLDVLAAVASGIDGHTVFVHQDPAGSVSLDIDQTIDVRIGETNEIDAKIRSVATVLDQVDLTCLEQIDVRIAERPVLTRDQQC